MSRREIVDCGANMKAVFYGLWLMERIIKKCCQKVSLGVVS